MTVKAIKELIKDLPDEFTVVMEFGDGSVGEFKVEPITVSCDNPEIIGFIIVPDMVKH